MRLSLFILAAALAVPAVAQSKLELKLDSVAAKAKQKTEIDLDSSALALASSLAPMAGKQMDAAKLKMLKDALAGVKALSIRAYEFEGPGGWSQADLEPIRKQLGEGSGWKRMINVKDGDESTEIYLLSDGEKPGGFLLMAGEKKGLNVVYVLGNIALDQMKELVSSNIVYNLKDLPPMGPPPTAPAR